jgi:hypothetical protein
MYRRDVAKTAVAAQWPRTEGLIESCAVSFHRAQGENDYDSWTVDLAYSYAVSGRRYDGKRIRLGPQKHYSVEKEAHAEAALFPAGSRAEVAYDPADPAKAVLRTDKPSATWRTFAWIFGAIGVVLLLLSLLPAE